MLFIHPYSHLQIYVHDMVCVQVQLNKKETNRLKHNYMFVKRCPVKDQ